MTRGERRYRSDRASKRRLCKMMDEGGDGKVDAHKPFAIKAAKTRHPYSGAKPHSRHKYWSHNDLDFRRDKSDLE